MLEHLSGFDIIIDVRSPSEFRESHIPNALNLPVFSDEEFREVGTIYKVNPLDATFKGASIACKNISNLLLEHRDVLNHKFKILLYCARGGNRSLSLYAVLNAMRLRVERLNGGYKAYRRYVVDNMPRVANRQFLTLCGNTGCGKSELISMASSWSIDLERLCNHYGSAFGFLSGIQPSEKMFENNLFSEFFNKTSDILLIENESKKLGKLVLPSALYHAYQNAPKILVESCVQNRINRIVRLYKDISKEDFSSAMAKISPYIKKDIKQEIIDAFDRGDLNRVAEILLLKYYDKVYKKIECEYRVNSDDLERAYKELENIRDEIRRKNA